MLLVPTTLSIFQSSPSTAIIRKKDPAFYSNMLPAESLWE